LTSKSLSVTEWGDRGDVASLLSGVGGINRFLDSRVRVEDVIVMRSSTQSRSLLEGLVGIGWVVTEGKCGVGMRINRKKPVTVDCHTACANV
jgi:hypothetical protein